MADRTTVGGLQVAPALHAFVRDEALPGSGVDEAAFWSGVEAILAEFAPRNRELLERRDELQRQLDEWHTAHPGPVSDPAAYLQLLRELGYLVDEPADFTIETQDVDDEVAVQAGPAAGRADAQRAVRGQRGQRPLGLAVRRALRHRRAPRGRRPGAWVVVQPEARRRGHREGAGLPRRALPAGRRQPRRRDRLRRRGRRADGDARRRLVGACRPWPVRRPPRRRCRPRGRAAGPPRAARRDPGRPHRRDRQGRRRRGQGPAHGGRGLHDHGPRGLGRGGRRRRQGRRLPQLAPPQPGHADRRGGQGRLDVHPSTRAGPGLRRTRRRGRAAGSLAALRAPGRSPDDDRRDPGRHGREEVPEGILDAVHDGAVRLVDIQGRGELSNSRTGSMYAVKPKMHGPDEVALHRRAVRGGRGPARAAPRRDQARDHGRGAAYLGQPQGLHPRRSRPGGVHQHRLPRPHRRRAAHLDARRRR